MDHGPRAVAQHLQLHVPPAADEALQIDSAVAERGLRLRRSQGQHLLQPGQVVDPLHAAPAAAAHRLDQQGRADLAPEFDSLGQGRRRSAWDHGDARRLSLRAGAELVAHRLDLLGGGADEGDLLLFAEAGEFGPFGEEAVAGMDGVAA